MLELLLSSYGSIKERSAVLLSTTQFAYRKELGVWCLHACDELLCMSHTLQSALGTGQQARIVQIDFKAPFDVVNHQGILNKLCSVCIGGSVMLSLLAVSTDHSMLWSMVVRVNWLTLCHECRREVFWAHYCSFCTPQSFFHSGV